MIDQPASGLDELTAQVRRIADAMATPATTCSARHATLDDGRECIRAAQHHGDHIDERGFHWSDTVAVYPTGSTVRVAHWNPVSEQLTDERQELAGMVGEFVDAQVQHARATGVDLTPEWLRRGTRDLSIPEQRPAAEEQSLRLLRRESLLVLLTRLQRGRTLSEEETGTLRHHVETEIGEANTARAEAQRLGFMVDDYSTGARQLSETLRREKERADAAIERETVLEGEVEAQQAAIGRVRALADQWDNALAPARSQYSGPVRAALDGTEQPTTEQPSYAQLRAAYDESWQLIEMQKEFIGKLRRLIMTAITDRESARIKAESCVHCGRDHMNELYEAIIAADKGYAEAFPATADGPARPGRLPEMEA